MRIILHAVHTSGILVDIELEREEVEKVDAYIARLLQKGYRAPAQPQPMTPDGLPICTKHQVAMPAREKQGDVWHSHRIVTTDDQELFCRGVPYGPREKDGFFYVEAPVGWPSSGLSGTGMAP